MDVTKEAISKTLFIELELVMDIYSLVFWNIRFHLERKYHLEINNKEVASLYGKTLYEGIRDIITPKLAELKVDEEIDVDDQIREILDGFKSSSLSLKPTVPSIHVIQQLKKDKEVSVVLFTYLEMDTINTILDPAFVNLIDEIKSIHEISGKADHFSADFNMIIFGWVDFYLEFASLSNEKKVNIIHVKHPKDEEGLSLEVESFKNLDSIPFENYGFPKLGRCYEGSLMRVELNREFKTAELPFWKTTIPLDKIELHGRVVNGYKRGSKELGVPTANLEMWSENIQKIEHILPGVYCGTVQFLSYESNENELIDKYGDKYKGQKLRTALSIGWNPSYDNTQRTIEAYILEEFENDFYGEELRIEVTHYIRAESNYVALDHLIMAIHNDIETTKHTISTL